MKVKIFDSESFEKDIKKYKKEALLENDLTALTVYNGFEMLMNVYTVDIEIPDGISEGGIENEILLPSGEKQRQIIV